MSNKAQAWVWSLPRELPTGVLMSKSAKDVLGRLADYADSNWQCFPSQRLLAEELLMDVRSVKRAVAWLIENELLARVGYRYSTGEGSRGGRATTVYQVGPKRFESDATAILAGDSGNAEAEKLGDILSPNPKTPGQSVVDNSQKLGDILSPKSDLSQGLGDTDDRVRGQIAHPLKEEPPKNLKSSSVNKVTTEPAMSVRDDDDDSELRLAAADNHRSTDNRSDGDDLDVRLAGIDPRLSFQQLAHLMLEATGVQLNPRLTDVVSAARTVLARAGGNVMDPNAYVARSLALNPGEFATALDAPALPVEHVHQWRDFGDGSGRLYCGSCDPAGLNPTVWEETIAAF